jgi:hypothetical protein
MRLCTFEVTGHLGRHCRVGALRDGRIIDLNFATAWYLAQQGESEPQQLATALVPTTMKEFLAAGLRAVHTSEELFGGAGPRPADWWHIDKPPRGPNDETLVYMAGQVRLCAPLPSSTRVGSDEDVAFAGKNEPQLKFAAVIGKQGTKIGALEARGYIAGFTAMNDFGSRCSALGPCLVTPDEIGNPYALTIRVRVNGHEFGRTTSERRGPGFEDTIEAMTSKDVILPGDVIAFPIALEPPVRCGDLIELEIEKIGTLRTRVV